MSTRREYPGMAGNQSAVLAHQRRRRPAPLLDARRDCRNLSVRVGPGVFRIRDQPIDRPALDLIRRPRSLITRIPSRAGALTTAMPCHRLKHGRPSAREQQVGFSHSSRPRAVCTPFRHLAFWLSGRHLGGRCGRHLHLIRLGRDFGRGFGGDRTCNGGRIRSHWLARRRRVQQDRCREQAESEPARQRQPATPSRSREDET